MLRRASQSSAPAGAVAGGTAYSVTATASSGLPVVFSADASSAGVCTVSGSTVSFVGSGTCTVDANQAGDGSYQAAPQLQPQILEGCGVSCLTRVTHSVYHTLYMTQC